MQAKLNICHLFYSDHKKTLWKQQLKRIHLCSRAEHLQIFVLFSRPWPDQMAGRGQVRHGLQSEQILCQELHASSQLKSRHHKKMLKGDEMWRMMAFGTFYCLLQVFTWQKWWRRTNHWTGSVFSSVAKPCHSELHHRGRWEEPLSFHSAAVTVKLPQISKTRDNRATTHCKCVSAIPACRLLK